MVTSQLLCDPADVNPDPLEIHITTCLSIFPLKSLLYIIFLSVLPLTPPMYQLVGDTVQFVSSPRSGFGNGAVSIHAVPWMFHIILVTRLWLMWFTGNELNIWLLSITPLVSVTTTMWPQQEPTQTLVYSLRTFFLMMTLMNFIMKMKSRDPVVEKINHLLVSTLYHLSCDITETVNICWSGRWKLSECGSDVECHLSVHHLSCLWWKEQRPLHLSSILSLLPPASPPFTHPTKLMFIGLARLHTAFLWVQGDVRAPVGQKRMARTLCLI